MTTDLDAVERTYVERGNTITGRLHYRAAVTAGEPWHKNYREAVGELTRYSNENVTDALSIYGADAFGRDWTDALYIVDDGQTVRPYYVACYRAAGTFTHPYIGEHDAHLVLHPFPTERTADGAPIMRADGSAVNYSTWMLSPRRAFHVKVRPV